MHYFIPTPTQKKYISINKKPQYSLTQNYYCATFGLTQNYMFVEY